MKLIITGDESRVYGYDPNNKAAVVTLENPGSPRSKKTRQVRSKIKVMLIVFFDAVGIVHQENSSGPDSEQGILFGRHEEIKRGCSQNTTGVVAVLSLDASSCRSSSAHHQSCAAVPGKTRNNPSSTSSLLAGYVTS
ncbi:hypothetical protein TNCV_1032271 [Trichonephila clavipes]|nr:hypothetical protein TNCV_1032271 [Trichonephila clavipes]